MVLKLMTRALVLLCLLLLSSSIMHCKAEEEDTEADYDIIIVSKDMDETLSEITVSQDHLLEAVLLAKEVEDRENAAEMTDAGEVAEQQGEHDIDTVEAGVEEKKEQPQEQEKLDNPASRLPNKAKIPRQPRVEVQAVPAEERKAAVESAEEDVKVEKPIAIIIQSEEDSSSDDGESSDDVERKKEQQQKLAPTTNKDIIEACDNLCTGLSLNTSKACKKEMNALPRPKMGRTCRDALEAAKGACENLCQDYHTGAQTELEALKIGLSHDNCQSLSGARPFPAMFNSCKSGYNEGLGQVFAAIRKMNPPPGSATQRRDRRRLHAGDQSWSSSSYQYLDEEPKFIDVHKRAKQRYTAHKQKLATKGYIEERGPDCGCTSG